MPDRDAFLQLPDPDRLPPRIRRRLNDILAREGFGLSIQSYDPRTPPPPTPTEILYTCFDFFVGDDKIELQGKLMRTRRMRLETIPDAIKGAFSHLQGKTILPLEFKGLGDHATRPGDSISVFGVEFRRVSRFGEPPRTDTSLLPYQLEIDGVRYERVIPE